MTEAKGVSETGAAGPPSRTVGSGLTQRRTTDGRSADRFTLVAIDPPNPEASLAEEVRAGLTAMPKRLPCRFFYDEAGSRLFEEICALPEYYVTRAEYEILSRYAGEIVAGMPPAVTLVELGSGSAAKTRLVIEALLRRQETLRYVPVDISRAALEASARELVAAYPPLLVDAVVAEYQEGLRYLRDLAGPDAGAAHPELVLWLGSNVGNLTRGEAAAFLRRMRETMSPHDRLLIGVDVRKDRAVLQPAYDDAQGVTARFNKNLLARINRELGGHFDPNAFTHRAVYHEPEGRITMYLVSRHDQVVPIDALSLRVPFAAGEAIHTEDSYKYSNEEIQSLAAAAGYAVERQWSDAAHRFVETLMRPRPPV
jgi:L-histidine N-alpha-methyltransferase